MIGGHEKEKQNNGTEPILKLIQEKFPEIKSLSGTGYRLVNSKTYPNKTIRL